MAKHTHVALLRGLNVGGKNRLKMIDLAATFARAGASDVTTYLQSGNVVFEAPNAAMKHLVLRGVLVGGAAIFMTMCEV